MCVGVGVVGVYWMSVGVLVCWCVAGVFWMNLAYDLEIHLSCFARRRRWRRQRRRRRSSIGSVLLPQAAHVFGNVFVFG